MDKKFFFHGGVIALSRIELARIVSNWLVVLHNQSTQLIITGIGINVKWEVMIQIAKHGILSNQSLHHVKCILVSSSPNEFAFTSKLSQQGQQMQLPRPHIMVEGDCSNERMDLLDCSGPIHIQNGTNFLQPGFQTCRI
jgi:hypothetical protein